MKLEVPTTIEEVQLMMAQGLAATQEIIQGCQVRAAKYYEAQCKVEMEKSARTKEVGDIVADRTLIQSANFMRPSMVHPPALTQEGDDWVASYGALRASGPTPETAYQEFDRLWVGKDEL